MQPYSADYREPEIPLLYDRIGIFYLALPPCRGLLGRGCAETFPPCPPWEESLCSIGWKLSPTCIDFTEMSALWLQASVPFPRHHTCS
jgi:hypothetical protein